jgi:dTDP-glucose 4,6-dehydratase
MYPNIGNPDEIQSKILRMKYKVDWHKSKVVYFPLPINDPLQRQQTLQSKRIVRVGGQSKTELRNEDYL